MQVDTLEEAVKLINANPFGNGTSFHGLRGPRVTSSTISKLAKGINVPIPVPLPFFSFTGWKTYGDQHAYGKQAVRFYTETKTVTARWFDANAASGPNMTINLK